MDFKGVKMSCVIALLVVFLVSSEGRSLADGDLSGAVSPPGSPDCGDGCLPKEDLVQTPVGPPVPGKAGDTKTFWLISHILEKIPFFNKSHEATATISTSNAVPSIPVATVTTGK